MIKNYKIEFEIKKSMQLKNNSIKSNFAYYLYAILMENCPSEYADVLHNQDYTPISHNLTIINDKIIWEISLFSKAIDILDGVINCKKEWFIKKENITLVVIGLKQKQISIDDLFEKSKKMCLEKKSIKLEFKTTTAFKSNDAYQNVPSMHFIFQSIVNKWNGVFPQAFIEDEDGQGINAIIKCMNIKDFKIQGSKYAFKKQLMNGYKGYFILDCKSEGFHKELAYVLLIFSNYSGIGIKTAMGMGGVDFKILK